ncbi:MAG: DMT family transporter [Cyanobacteria bacterium P01_H01_bin.15]
MADLPLELLCMTLPSELPQSPTSLSSSTQQQETDSDRPRDVWALALLVIALFSVSCAPIFIRYSEMDIGPQATVLNRYLIFAAVFGLGRGLLYALRPNQKDTDSKPFRKKDWLLLGSIGLISTLSLSLWAISLTQTSVAKSVLLNNLTPIFTALAGWLFLGRSFDRQFLIGLAIAMTGAIALGWEDLQAAQADSLLGDANALLSAVFLAAYFMVGEQLRERFSASTILLWRCSVGCILLVPFVWFTEGVLFPRSVIGWLAVIGLGIICEGLGQQLLITVMDRLSSGFVSLFLLLEPLVSAILAWVLFAETLSGLTWIAFAVVITGIYLAKSSQSASNAH